MSKIKDIFSIKNGLLDGISDPGVLIGQPDGWYFWEDSFYWHGPFATEEEAKREYESYCETELDYGGVKSRVVNKGNRKLL